MRMGQLLTLCALSSAYELIFHLLDSPSSYSCMLNDKKKWRYPNNSVGPPYVIRKMFRRRHRCFNSPSEMQNLTWGAQQIVFIPCGTSRIWWYLRGKEAYLSKHVKPRQKTRKSVVPCLFSVAISLRVCWFGLGLRRIARQAAFRVLVRLSCSQDGKFLGWRESLKWAK